LVPVTRNSLWGEIPGRVKQTGSLRWLPYLVHIGDIGIGIWHYLKKSLVSGSLRLLSIPLLPMVTYKSTTYFGQVRKYANYLKTGSCLLYQGRYLFRYLEKTMQWLKPGCKQPSLMTTGLKNFRPNKHFPREILKKLNNP